MKETMEELPNMKQVTVNQFRDALDHICDLIIAAEPELTRIDNIVGDGDHGFGMYDGFTELKKELATDIQFETLRDLARYTGMVLVKSMGGASGVIFGTLFIGGVDAMTAPDGSFLTEVDADCLRRYFRMSAQAISNRGKARANDRTMLDALLWAADAMESTDTEDVAELLKAGWDGACAGAEATKNMIPRLGRTKNFRDKALGWPDPGAISTSIIFRGFYESFSGINNH